MPFFQRLKWNSIFPCSDDVHVWYQMEANMCANVNIKHTWKQNIQTYKDNVFVAQCRFSLRRAHYHYYQKSLKRWCTNSFMNTWTIIWMTYCGFHKAHSTQQHILSRLIRSLKKGTILMDLSKAYDCLPHDLSIAKLEAYGLDKPSVNLVNGYLCFWKQRKNIGSSYSDCYWGFSPRDPS